MKKAYLIVSSIASVILFGLLAFWVIAGGTEGLGFVLGTVFIAEIPILFWLPAALISFGIAFKLPKEKENLKNVLLAFPIITIVLLITAGEYHGP